MSEPGVGHNSIDNGHLKSFIGRLENLGVEKDAISGDIKDVKAEAKSAGYDVKTINKILKIRKMDKAKREEEEALLDTYMHALGLI